MGKRTNDVTHSYQVRFKTKELTNVLVDIQTGQRGFLLTGDDIFLEPYINGHKKLKEVQEELYTLVDDNKEQKTQLIAINSLIEDNLKALQNNVENIRNEMPVDTHQLYLGKVYMDRIRNLSQKFDEREVILLDVRNKFKEETDQKMAFYLLGLSSVSLIFLVIFFRLLYLELKQRISLQSTLENKLVELERTNTELEQFAYITSHDLQEPLRKIRAFAERLSVKQSAQLTDDAKTNIQKINQSASRMQQLINDLLTFSRVTNLKEVIHDKINLNDILIESKEDFSELIYQKKASIYSQTLPTIKGVRVQFLQLFNNLISNSLKYSRADVAPIIEIEYKQVTGNEIPNAGKLQQENIYHKLTFIDNGIGFEQQYTEKIFTIFQRLHNRNEYEGTGIGLSLCRRIVTNHSGFMFAEAKKEEQGAVFYIYLPT
jgi:signal transduction histidine kinase